MGFEPNAARRLRLVAHTTADLMLRQELASVLEDPTMAQVPSVELARAIARCSACTPAIDGAPARAGLCAEHRTLWNREAIAPGDPLTLDAERALERLLHDALSTEDGGTEFLAAYERQQRALEAVWEAHRRGAVALPASVAEKVEAARTAQPRFLRGGRGRSGAGAR